MKSVKLNDADAELILALYEDEMQEVEEYLRRLKDSVANLINQMAPKQTDTIKVPKKRGRKPNKSAKNKQSVEVTAEPKKRGPKPKAVISPVSEIIPAEVKPRGRKAKAKVEPSVENIPAEVKTRRRKSKAEPAIENVPAEVKPRGRKSKATNETMAVTEETLKPAAKVTKKRKASPKNKAKKAAKKIAVKKEVAAVQEAPQEPVTE